MEKLISMTDFVLEQSESIKSDMIGYGEFIDKVVNYAKFLKQPLKLEMFVPCANGEPLPVFYSTKWYKAKANVLFDNFTILSNEDDVIELECKDIYINYNKEEDLFHLDSWNNDALIMNIECLANLINHTASSIKLTSNAIKTFK